MFAPKININLCLIFMTDIKFQNENVFNNNGNVSNFQNRYFQLKYRCIQLRYK